MRLQLTDIAAHSFFIDGPKATQSEVKAEMRMKRSNWLTFIEFFNKNLPFSLAVEQYHFRIKKV